MATLSLVATVEDANVPPRIKVVVTDTGTPTISTVTVTRTDPSGQVVNVRTPDGSPLILVTSGSNRVGTIYDYEAPFGQAVSYSTTVQPLVYSNSVTVGEDRVWLIHPGLPARSMPIELMRGSLSDEQEAVEAGVFFPLGRRNAVVISDGRRKAPSGELIVGTETREDRAALGDLLSDAFPLLLNVPPSLGLDIDTAYIHVGTVRRTRPSDIGTDPLRFWTLPFQVVDIPVGGTQAQRTWQNVLDGSATWQAVLNTFPTWGDVQAPTT